MYAHRHLIIQTFYLLECTCSVTAGVCIESCGGISAAKMVPFELGRDETGDTEDRFVESWNLSRKKKHGKEGKHGKRGKHGKKGKRGKKRKHGKKGKHGKKAKHGKKGKHGKRRKHGKKGKHGKMRHHSKKRKPGKKEQFSSDMENRKWVQDIEDIMREIPDIVKERKHNGDESWNFARKGKHGKKRKYGKKGKHGKKE